MKKINLIYIAALFILLSGVQLSYAQSEFDLETGIVSTGMSDVRIPGDSGDLFSLTDDLKAETPPYLRLRYRYFLGERHSLTALYAPLTIMSKGEFAAPINYYGKVFPADTPIEATYRFNSYRLTYRYDWIKKPQTQFGIGFTAKIRDAEIALKGGGQSASKTNIGFVPIIHFRLQQHLDERFSLLLEGDALAAPQGRAEDVQAAVRFQANQHWGLRLGYRILEGGADNAEVYNFALIHYAALGIEYKL